MAEENFYPVTIEIEIEQGPEALGNIQFTLEHDLGINGEEVVHQLRNILVNWAAGWAKMAGTSVTMDL